MTHTKVDETSHSLGLSKVDLFIEALERTHFMALATSADETPWVCPVYFVYDAAFNLYFRSDSSTQHMANIRRNAEVASAIYPSVSLAGHKVAGIQLSGKAAVLGRTNDIALANDTYFARVNPELIGRPAEAKRFFAATSDWRWVRIRPSRVYYLDNRYYGYQRQPVAIADIRRQLAS